MIFIGLTGGMGMGKSAVADVLERRGLPVVDTDATARMLVQPGQPALAAIVARFGSHLLGPDGLLRRDLLAQCVFSNPAHRRDLEAILHPRIREVWQAQATRWRQQGVTRAVAVVPLLYEADLAGEFDRVICVACSRRTQRERLAPRGWDEAQVQGRLQAQWAVEKKMALADFVVWSEGGLEVLAAQVDLILASLG
jgi:dephospho-CoA kinase